MRELSSSLLSLGFDLSKHVVVAGVVKHNSLGKALTLTTFDEGLEEGIRHTGSLRSGAGLAILSLRLSVTVAALPLTHGY